MMLDDLNKKMKANNEFPSDFYKMKEGDNRMRILSDFTEVNTITKAGGKWGGHITEKNQPVINKDPSLTPEEQYKKSDKKRMQGWAWAIARNVKQADGSEMDELKIVQFGSKILDQLVAYRHNPEYAFDSFPIPYDINIQTTNAGKMEVVYVVQPARQNTDVTAEEMAKLNKKKSIKDIVGAIIAKQDGEVATKADVAYPENDLGDQQF